MKPMSAMKRMTIKKPTYFDYDKIKKSVLQAFKTNLKILPSNPILFTISTLKVFSINLIPTTTDKADNSEECYICT